MTIKTMTLETVERQRRYVAEQQQRGDGMGLVFADAFLRGMRDIGYKNPAWAVAEMIDNSWQAAASTVSIVFGYHKSTKTQVKPDQLAVIDNGNGMIPEMLSYAVRWGGTDREGDREGLGRYGYGLPSSAVSLAKRYSVYSKVRDGSWHVVTIDIDELAAVASDAVATQRLLAPRADTPPAWVLDADLGDGVGALRKQDSSTVVLLEELDRLDRLGGWKKASSLRTKFLEHFGSIYRHWLPERRLIVDAVPVQAVDPLFLMEHARFYAETSVLAERVETRTVEVVTDRGTTGRVRLRASFLPGNFARQSPEDLASRTNKRFDIMKRYNGILICREGRHIDTVQPAWTTFQNNDRYVKIEIDFDAELDEFFGITTAKQQIGIEDEMWQKLQHDGTGGGALVALVKDLRGRFDESKAAIAAKAQNATSLEEPRPSEQAMEISAKFKRQSRELTEAQRTEAERNLRQKAKERAQVTREPEQEVERQLEEETSRRPWMVEFTTIPEGPFYRPTRLGEQRRLLINTDHPFYAKVYSVAPEAQAALEVLLFVLAERELEVKDDAERFYKAERQNWSERLRHALDALTSDESIVDRASSMAEELASPAT